MEKAVIVIIFKRIKKYKEGALLIPVKACRGYLNEKTKIFRRDKDNHEYVDATKDAEFCYAMTIEPEKLQGMYACDSCNEAMNAYLKSARENLHFSSLGGGIVQNYSVDFVSETGQALGVSSLLSLFSIHPSDRYDEINHGVTFASIPQLKLDDKEKLSKIRNFLQILAAAKQKVKIQVKGQDEAIDIIFARFLQNEILTLMGKEYGLNMSHILVSGPTGVGKTKIFKVAAPLLGKPLKIVTATDFTINGYVGEDINNMLVRLIEAANGNVKLAEKGIIYIDEFDKLVAIRDSGPTEGVQSEILTFLSGTTVNVMYKGKSIPFNTEYVTFVLSGSFSYLLESKKTTSIGFGAKEREEQEVKLTLNDYVRGGVLRDTLGRTHGVLNLKPLTYEVMLEILRDDPYNALRTKIEMLRIIGINIEYDNSLIEYVAKEAMKCQVGARGIGQVVEEQFDPIFTELMNNPSQNFADSIHFAEDGINGFQRRFGSISA